MQTPVPLELETSVVYRGEVAKITGRCKPVGANWRYDVEVNGKTQIAVEAEEIVETKRQ